MPRSARPRALPQEGRICKRGATYWSRKLTRFGMWRNYYVLSAREIGRKVAGDRARMCVREVSDFDPGDCNSGNSYM